VKKKYEYLMSALISLLVVFTMELHQCIVSSTLDFLWILLNNGYGWLKAYLRVLAEGYRSGYVHGTPFKNAQGSWAINWRLGGPPFIHVIISIIFWFVFVSPIILISLYLLRKYSQFQWLKKRICYPKGLLKFTSCISACFIIIMIAISLVGFTGRKINLNIILPAEALKDYLGCNIGMSVVLDVTVTRPVVLEVNPSVLDKNNMSGWFCCIIKPPENSCWNIEEVDSFTISLNNTTIPYTSSTYHNNTELLAMFEKSSIEFVIKTETSKLEAATLRVNGKLKNGHFLLETHK
jgi:hypothetical protein